MDLRGELQENRSDRIRRQGQEMAVEYAEGLYFYQSDIEEFLKTKAAAATMVAVSYTHLDVYKRQVDT